MFTTKVYWVACNQGDGSIAVRFFGDYDNFLLFGARELQTDECPTEDSWFGFQEIVTEDKVEITGSIFEDDERALTWFSETDKWELEDYIHEMEEMTKGYR